MSDADRILVPTVNDLVASVHLTSVRLLRKTIRGDATGTLTARRGTPVGMESRAGIFKRDQTSVSFLAGVRLWVPQASPAETAPFLLDVDRLVEYGGVPMPTTEETLHAFARTSVLLTAWPYLRADVHQACLELDVPPLILPLVKSPHVGSGSNGSSPLAGHWRTCQERLTRLVDHLSEFLDAHRGSSLDRLEADESRSPDWGFALDVLRHHHDALLARLDAAAPLAEATHLATEALSLVLDIGRAMEQRVDHYRRRDGDGLERWNEVARGAEELFNEMRESGFLDRANPIRIKRLR